MENENRKAGAAAGDTAADGPLDRTDPRTATLDRWLARLSMSFLIVAAVLGWQGYQLLVAGAAFWRTGVHLFAAAAALALAVTGLRRRHRAAPP